MSQTVTISAEEYKALVSDRITLQASRAIFDEGANICNAFVAGLDAVNRHAPSLFDAALAKVTDPAVRKALGEAVIAVIAVHEAMREEIEEARFYAWINGREANYAWAAFDLAGVDESHPAVDKIDALADEHEAMLDAEREWAEAGEVTP